MSGAIPLLPRAHRGLYIVIFARTFEAVTLKCLNLLLTELMCGLFGLCIALGPKSHQHQLFLPATP